MALVSEREGENNYSNGIYGGNRQRDVHFTTSRMTWQRGTIFVLLSLVIAVSAVDYTDVDCGWTGIKEQQCINKGCVWLEGFPGPWCQMPDSPYIPSTLDLGFNNMTSDQQVVLNYSILSLVLLSLAVLTANVNTLLSKDWVVVAILLVLAIITRYHDLENPKEIVFDEYYFGDFANSYCNGIYVFDIHPPLAAVQIWVCAPPRLGR